MFCKAEVTDYPSACRDPGELGVCTPKYTTEARSDYSADSTIWLSPYAELSARAIYRPCPSRTVSVSACGIHYEVASATYPWTPAKCSGAGPGLPAAGRGSLARPAPVPQVCERVRRHDQKARRANDRRHPELSRSDTRPRPLLPGMASGPAPGDVRHCE